MAKRKNEIVIAKDKKDNKVVVIDEIIFKGRKKLPWKEVEKYLKRYIGAVVQVSETAESVYIDKDFPDEYKGSEDTKKARGASAKAKANAVQGILQMIENVITHYNIYIATLVVRKNEKGKLSLYDVVNVKKESQTAFEL